MDESDVGGRAAAVRTAITLTSISAAGLMMFCWPLLWAPEPGVGHEGDAVVVFAIAMPVLIAVAAAELTRGRLDVKSLAMLGVLSAIGAVLRPLGAGIGGVETVFFLIVLGGRVYGPTFGFLLGSTTLASSAFLTAGIGPWLPFQMLAASWVGMGAGLLPPLRGRAEIALLAAYGAISGFAFGLLMNLWFWPFSIGADTQISFEPGAAVVDNLRTFVRFSIVTSTAAWDVGRAVTTAVAVVVAGPSALTAMRRASRRARFVGTGSRPPGRRGAVATDRPTIGPTLDPGEMV